MSTGIIDPVGSMPNLYTLRHGIWKPFVLDDSIQQRRRKGKHICWESTEHRPNKPSPHIPALKRARLYGDLR